MRLFGTKKNAAHYKKKPRKRGRIFKILGLVCLAILLVAGGTYFALDLLIRPPEVETYIPRDRPDASLGESSNDPEMIASAAARPFTILLVGQDSENGLTDTLMLCSIDAENGEVSVVSIPRDTKIPGPWHVPKINGVLPITNSMDRLLDEVETLAGFRPDHYVVVDMAGFEVLVDTLEGVEFNVPLRMLYVDPYQNPPLHIDFYPGYQHLDGAQALQVVRFRNSNRIGGSSFEEADIGRIQTQQAFLRAVAAELLQARNILRIPDFANIFVQHVDTNLSIGNLAWFATQLAGLDSEDISFLTLPGDYDAWIGTGSYVIVDAEAWIEMVNTYLNPLPDPVTLEHVSIVTWVGDSLETVGNGMPLTRRN